MTSEHADELLALLRQQPLPLGELHGRIRTWGSTWTPEQLELFLLCATGVTRGDAGTFLACAPSAEDDLRAALVEVVRSLGGRPVPAAQVRARLPSHFVTTDEQIVALVRRMPGLELVGPGLVRTREGHRG